MQIAQSPSDRPLLETPEADRRRKTRITHPFPSTVCGVDAAGEAFRCMTVIDNLSASGLYLRLRQKLNTGSRLSVVIHIAGLPAGDDPEPHVFFRGEVRRIECRQPDAYGYGIISRSHQLRYLKFINAVSALGVRSQSARTFPRRAVEFSKTHPRA